MISAEEIATASRVLQSLVGSKDATADARAGAELLGALFRALKHTSLPYEVCIKIMPPDPKKVVSVTSTATGLHWTPDDEVGDVSLTELVKQIVVRTKVPDIADVKLSESGKVLLP